MQIITSPDATRRQLLLAAGGAAVAIGAPRAVGATPGPQMVERAQRFVALLDGDASSAARFAFTDPTRARWNFMGASVKPGLPLETMNQPQREAAMDLVAAALSPEGVAKAERVMVLQDVLREASSRPTTRNRDRFSFAVFGEPSTTAPWGWRIEGHHLSLSFTLVGEEVVSVTPSSFSSNPNVVHGGRHEGLVALVDEERMARTAYGDLSPPHRDVALIQERAFGNILTTAGREDRLGAPEAGVPLGDLHPAQAELLLRLVEIYALDHLAPALAEQQRARLRECDLDAVRFGWAGSDRPGEMMYYRLHGETFLIEFASLRNEPLHLHTIRHDLDRNLGAHVVA